MAAVEEWGLDAFEDDPVLACLHPDATLCIRQSHRVSRAVLRIVAHLNVGAANDAPHLAWARLDTSHLRLSRRACRGVRAT